MANQPSRREYDLDIPADVEPGTYADFASIWHTSDSFVIDFAVVKRPPKSVENDDGSRVTKVPTRVVSRVRIPPSQVFEIMKGLEKQLSMWERTHGKKQRPPEGS
ncbi:DUF3467 domain-containing protein [Actinobacteria bacterium YIM 96077]|uniref:DUF3467 domain-containing protein n=1 Tax=Phytoactinopolyspora halophila TaxID=1981511 RepID=A0A329Q9U0_9ACTN|nr:DUF3467 domain-containing protein [Phytoactinopolyspora halophila]AYY12246.1 DUF3467 domain-containing protein [Actinobacteria bacterium YIM 96077]RAW09165.1 DUF3467 domain-containing protein [Phytoactinopolyspora halophila]